MTIFYFSKTNMSCEFIVLFRYIYAYNGFYNGRFETKLTFASSDIGIGYRCQGYVWQ